MVPLCTILPSTKQIGVPMIQFTNTENEGFSTKIALSVSVADDANTDTLLKAFLSFAVASTYSESSVLSSMSKMLKDTSFESDTEESLTKQLKIAIDMAQQSQKDTSDAHRLIKSLREDLAIEQRKYHINTPFTMPLVPGDTPPYGQQIMCNTEATTSAYVAEPKPVGEQPTTTYHGTPVDGTPLSAKPTAKALRDVLTVAGIEVSSKATRKDLEELAEVHCIVNGPWMGGSREEYFKKQSAGVTLEVVDV